VVLTVCFAGSTIGNTIGKALLAKVLKAGVIVRELAFKITDCVP
jgi:hypothetical protein